MYPPPNKGPTWTKGITLSLGPQGGLLFGHWLTFFSARFPSDSILFLGGGEVWAFIRARTKQGHWAFISGGCIFPFLIFTTHTVSVCVEDLLKDVTVPPPQCMLSHLYLRSRIFVHSGY